jgi:hypothetical protein
VSKVNAHGGYLVPRDSQGNFFRVDAAEFELDLEEIIDDVTDSRSGGSAEGLPCLVKVQSVSMSVAEDDVSYPEVLGLTIGAVVDLYMRRGSRSEWDLIVDAIVKGYRKVNDNNGKARRIMVTFEYGVYFHNVTGPPGF